MLVVCIEIKFSRRLRDIKVTSYNENATFTCELSKADLDITWLKDDQELNTDDREGRVRTDSYGQTRRLVISQVCSQDAGLYTAVYRQCAHNSISTSAVLIVLRMS